MSEEMVIRCCAPTLAGLKTGSLFSCVYDARGEVLESVRALNRVLWKKGVRVLPLRYLERRALIYVYRPAQLRRDLERDEAGEMLRRMGYTWKKPEQCLRQLIHKMEREPEFPHEIGLFLGYPPEDVAGFIENRAQGYKCVGCWKVYGDVTKAQRTFAQYRKCSAVYYDRWRKGTSIERLTAAV